jgi:hypothetical protein
VSNTLYVTPAQVLAAQLAVELSEEDGEEPDEALKAIANAQIVHAEQVGADDSEATGLADDASEAAQNVSEHNLLMNLVVYLEQLQEISTLHAAEAEMEAHALEALRTAIFQDAEGSRSRHSLAWALRDRAAHQSDREARQSYASVLKEFLASQELPGGPWRIVEEPGEIDHAPDENGREDVADLSRAEDQQTRSLPD